MNEVENRIILHCGYDAFKQDVEALIRAGNIATETPCHVIIDAPIGFAIQPLEKLRSQHTLAITDNPCPEYWDDLWDLEPNVLLAGGFRGQEFLVELARATRGESYRKTPRRCALLTLREREAFKLCAMGKTNNQIAEALRTKVTAIKTYLHRAFTKLNLAHRNEALLYYWGLWQFLEECRVELNLELSTD